MCSASFSGPAGRLPARHGFADHQAKLRARPDRTVSSSLPARLRPAVPPAYRLSRPGRLAWTRPLLSRTAQRLHAGVVVQVGCATASALARRALRGWLRWLVSGRACLHPLGSDAGSNPAGSPLCLPANHRPVCSLGFGSLPYLAFGRKFWAGKSGTQQQIALEA
jgi:hypothetical protein